MAITAAESRSYHQAYYQANKASILARVKARYEAKRAEVTAYKKVYAARNKKRLAAKSKAYYEVHREERIAYQKALHQSKPEAVKAYKKEWWDKNKTAYAVHRSKPETRAAAKITWKDWYDRTYQSKHRLTFCARNAKRRALKATTKVEPIDFMQILKDSLGVCGICRKPLDLFGIDFDHIVPLSKGGTHTRANLQATHAYCNRSKGARVG